MYIILTECKYVYGDKDVLVPLENSDEVMLYADTFENNRQFQASMH